MLTRRCSTQMHPASLLYRGPPLGVQTPQTAILETFIACGNYCLLRGVAPNVTPTQSPQKAASLDHVLTAQRKSLPQRDIGLRNTMEPRDLTPPVRILYRDEGGKEALVCAPI